MSKIIYIALHELRRMFKSPLAWVMLAVVQFLLAIFFLFLLSLFLDPAPWLIGRGLTEIVVTGFLQIVGIVMLLITPFITMRLFSEEQQTGTMALLLSSPISITELVLGKYLGIICFLLTMLAMIALMPFSLYLGATLDLGQLCAAFLGLFLLMSSFAAIGLFISTLTSQTTIAAIITFGALFMLWILDLAAKTGAETLQAVLTYLSLLSHYNQLIDGMFSSVDVVYYLIISTTFIILSILRLDSGRISA